MAKQQIGSSSKVPLQDLCQGNSHHQESHPLPVATTATVTICLLFSVSLKCSVQKEFLTLLSHEITPYLPFFAKGFCSLVD